MNATEKFQALLNEFSSCVRELGIEDELIVHCEDCAYFMRITGRDYFEDFDSGPWWCNRWNSNRITPMGYCAWGHRR